MAKPLKEELQAYYAACSPQAQRGVRAMTTTPNRNPRITVTMPPDLYQQVLAAAEAADLPIVYWARAAFRAKLKEEQQ